MLLSNKNIRILFCLAICASWIPEPGLQAQPSQFIYQGSIEFERKINLWAQMKDWDDGWSDFAKKTTPNFKTSYFNLEFTGTKTLYSPGRENPDNNRNQGWINDPADDNTIYTDIQKQQVVARKRVFEQTFLIQDSSRRIRWKITDETRTIAGFLCRRANAIIMDSIYVVAFYTDEITCTGGPESFLGLPGMILGVALPHQHITWFATRVDISPVPGTKIQPPQKGKKTNYSGLKAALNESLKDWGKYANKYIVSIMM